MRIRSMPETTEEKPSREGDAELARAALEHAARCAEGDGASRPAGPVSREDARALGRRAVRSYLDRILLARHADLGLDALQVTGVLSAVLPEVHALVGLSDYEWRHKDVWRHTKQVVIQTVPRLAIRWAALLHDIGKPKTRRIEGGTVTFIGHPEVGARLFDRLDRREKLFADDPELRTTVRFLVLFHQRASQYETDWTDSAVRRFGRELGAHLTELLLLARADMTTKHRAKKRRMLYSIKELQDRIEALAKEDARVPPLPTGVGDAIMAEFSIPPSRLIGDIKRWLEELVEMGELPSQAAFEVYVEHLRQHRDRFGL
jgi:poly(A) polymerase